MLNGEQTTKKVAHNDTNPLYAPKQYSTMAQMAEKNMYVYNDLQCHKHAPGIKMVYI